MSRLAKVRVSWLCTLLISLLYRFFLPCRGDGRRERKKERERDGGREREIIFYFFLLQPLLCSDSAPVMCLVCQTTLTLNFWLSFSLCLLNTRIAGIHYYIQFPDP